ncbi:hypothetical protein C0992_003954 [Termitomyces sp. T32_za158]|nr:hypothetical protein C0992_003954 [Termitomyces sp. T32_za158]
MVGVQVSAGPGAVASSDFMTSYAPSHDSSNELSRRQATDLGTLATTFKTSTWIWTIDGAPPLLLAPPEERIFRWTYLPPAGKTAVLAEVLITADNKYSLFVNGALVGASPADADSWEKAQGYRMALNPGPVVFAVSATNAPTAAGGANAAGLLVAVRITHSDATQVLFGTDKTWRSSILVVPSFQSPTLDDSKWPFATELDKFGKGPWGLHVALPVALTAVSLPPAATTSSAVPSTSSSTPLPSSTTSTTSSTTSSLPLTTSSTTSFSSTSSTVPTIVTITSTTTSESDGATLPAASTTSTSDSNSGTNPAIIGGALGGVLGAFALLGLGLLLWRKHKRGQDSLVAADFDTWTPAAHVNPPTMSQTPGPSSSPSTLRQPQYPDTSDQYAQQAPHRYPPPSVSMAGGAEAAYAGQYGGGYSGYGAHGYGQSGYASQEFGSSTQLVSNQNNANAGTNVPPSMMPGSTQGYYPPTGAGQNPSSTPYDHRYY